MWTMSPMIVCIVGGQECYHRGYVVRLGQALPVGHHNLKLVTFAPGVLFSRQPGGSFENLPLHRRDDIAIYVGHILLNCTD